MKAIIGFIQTIVYNLLLTVGLIWSAAVPLIVLYLWKLAAPFLFPYDTSNILKWILSFILAICDIALLVRSIDRWNQFAEYLEAIDLRHNIADEVCKNEERILQHLEDKPIGLYTINELNEAERSNNENGQTDHDWNRE